MLTTNEKVSFLSEVSSFHGLTPAQYKKLASICTEEFYLAGDRIFNQGEADGALFVIVDGRVVLEREIRDHTDTVSLNVVQTGDYFGEISLFYDAPWSVAATATRATTVLKLLNDDFGAFIREHPDLLVKLNSVISQRLVEAHVKISEITWGERPLEVQKLYERLEF
jgi:CRP/FNR family transcriptional regulator